MSLHTKLKRARTEEDVKDAYIKALGLRNLTKGLVDIQADGAWFEAKIGKHSTYAMMTQLLHYVKRAYDRGTELPPALVVIDSEKAGLMRTADIMHLMDDPSLKWAKSASKFGREIEDRISVAVAPHLVSYRIETHEPEFINAYRDLVATGEIIRAEITAANLRQVFDKWVAMVGVELSNVDPSDYAVFFFADIMNDGTRATHSDLGAELIHVGGKPAFVKDGVVHKLASVNGYREFWTSYHRPPKAEYRDYLLARRDSLLPTDERAFKGAFYTPLPVVDRAYELLAANLGANWQEEYVVWDMCCGVGNLTVRHSNYRNVFMSTLDQADVDVMKAARTCVGAHRFQYDYLNDDIADDGTIDYTLTNKVPQELRDAIAEGRKLLVLINPPYAEATDAAASVHNAKAAAVFKSGVSGNAAASINRRYGKANKELFTQFVSRIKHEMPGAKLAMFSTLKYVSAPNFEQFRANWTAEFLDGFVVPSRVFDGLKGKFPIGLLLWDTGSREYMSSAVEVSVLDEDATRIGTKVFYNGANDDLLNKWIVRPRSEGIPALPLKNAVSVATAAVRVDSTCTGSIGYFVSGGNDLQHAEQMTLLLSSVCSSGNGMYITADNIGKILVTFAARRLVVHNWLLDRDQFFAPVKELTAEFTSDCAMWSLFHRSNRTAGADDLEWNDKKWSIVNHFIPFTEREVGASERFESNFMSKYLKKLELSDEARLVLEEGRKIWASYFEVDHDRKMRDELKLNRPDVGWYQVRNAMKGRTDFSAFEAAFRALGDKLRPQVYEFGFLR